MKCKLRVEREVMEFLPGTETPFAPPTLVSQCRREGKRLIAPVGTIIDDPECWRIVMNGQADAADAECSERCQQTDAERAATLHAAARLDAGIDPEDFELFDKGYISGYRKDGSYKPGPNWAEFQAQQAADNADEDDI